MTETLTIHSSYFDVVKSFSISATIENIAGVSDTTPVSGIGAVISAIASASATAAIGVPPGVITLVASASADSIHGSVFHSSVFHILYIESIDDSVISPIVAIDGYPVICSISDLTPEISNVADVSSEVELYQVFHKSWFDVVKPYILETVECNAIIANDVIGFISSVISGEMSLVSEIDASPFVIQILKGIGAEIGLVAGVSATAEWVVPNVKTIQFGSLTLTHAIRNGNDKITPLTNAKITNSGIIEPRAYTRVINIRGETDSIIDYNTLVSWIGRKYTLYVYGFAYPDAYVSSISDRQVVAATGRWYFDVEFSHNVYSVSDSVSFNGMDLSNPSRVNDDVITPIIDNRLVKAGISQPRSYTRKISLECVTESTVEYTTLLNDIGLVSDTLVINGVTYDNTSITDISAIQPRGGGNIWSYTIDFVQNVIYGSDTGSFDLVTLPNIQSVGDIKKTAIYDDKLIKLGISESVSYSATVTLDCIATSSSEYNTILGKVNISGTLVINGISYSNARITDISDSHPRGGGINAVYLFSVSFTWYVLASAHTGSFGVYTLPNIQTISDVKRTSISDDKLIKAGKDTDGSYYCTVVIDCISNGITNYTNLRGLLGTFKTLTYTGFSGETAIMTDISAAIPHGSSNVYTFSVSFTWYKFNILHSATFGAASYSLPNVQQIGDIEISTTNPDIPSFANLKYAITQTSITIECIGTQAEYEAVLTYTGVKSTLTTYIGSLTKSYPYAEITRVSAAIPKGCAGMYVFSVTFALETGETAVTAWYGVSTNALPNAVRASPDKITPVYQSNTNTTGVTVAGVKTVRRSWSFECVASDKTVYNAVTALVGTKTTLSVNSESFAGVYITNLSSLYPRGGGTLFKFTIDFESDSSGIPVPVTFGGTTLANATMMSKDYEILKSRTVLHDGRISASLSSNASRIFAFSCIEIDKTEYNALAYKIGSKLALIVDGVTIPKAYISQLSASLQIGDGSVKLYSYTVEFEECDV